MATVTYSQMKNSKRVAEPIVKNITDDEAEEELVQRLSSGYQYRFRKRFHRSATLSKVHPSGILLLITIMFEV
jgi:hypothetical protein